MPNTAGEIRARLFELQDVQYKEFQQRLMPTVPDERVIGVRTPALRRLGKELVGTEEAKQFLLELPHYYYEENNLHAFLLERIGSINRALDEVERFLPYVDNWATCDSLNPRIFLSNKYKVLLHIRKWMTSDMPYTVRFGIGQLQRLFLDDEFSPDYLEWVAAVKSDEYYVNMMRAWFFATALAKQPEATWPWLEEGRLDEWTHNKTIQKAKESLRISPADKLRLSALRLRANEEP